MDITKLSPVVVYDDQCYLCSKFASFVKFLARGKLNFVGHYTDQGKEIREKLLSPDALEMFWFIDATVAYGGRAALLPLGRKIMSISTQQSNNTASNKIERTCDVSCKTPKAVILRSASLLTHSKKIYLSNFST